MSIFVGTIEASFRLPIMVAPSHSHIIVSLLLHTIQVPNGKFKQIPTRFIKIIAAYGRSPEVTQCLIQNHIYSYSRLPCINFPIVVVILGASKQTMGKQRWPILVLDNFYLISFIASKKGKQRRTILVFYFFQGRSKQ